MKLTRLLAAFLLPVILLSPVALTAKPLRIVRPERVGMDSQRLLRADSAIQDAIDKGNIPGAVLAVVRHGRMAYLKAYGNRQVYPTRLPMTTNAIFDMASCSKAMSTALCVMRLCEEGKIRLLDPVNLYIPDFKDWTENGETTTIRIQHLLTHTSGLPAYASVNAAESDKRPAPDALMRHISQLRRLAEPGTEFRYSCLNFITLQHIVETVSGESLRQFARRHIFDPLGMNHTDYLPCAPDAEGRWHNTARPCWAAEGEDDTAWREFVAPTERQADGSVLSCMVHDPLARLLNGGISGNAGVFSCAEDIAVLCAALQNGGEWDGHRILQPQTVRLLRTVPAFAARFGRTMGWDNSSAYASCNGDLLSSETYCHTGFTGTEIVIDPQNDCSVILLINAVHPDGGKGVVRLRSVVSNAVAASIVE